MDPENDNATLVCPPFNDADSNIDDMLMQPNITYKSEDNYYKLWWQAYLKNEMLLKEYADIINEKEEVKKKVVNIKVHASPEILRRRHRLPRQSAQRKEKAPKEVLQRNQQKIQMPVRRVRQTLWV